MFMKTPYNGLSAQSLKRHQGVELIFKGYDNDDIAAIVDVTVRTVRHWRKKLKNNAKLCALPRKKGSGRVPRLSLEQKQQLKEIILGGAVAAGYPDERWTSKIIADLIQKTFGITLAPRSVRDLLPTLGLSPQKPVVKSHKHSDEVALRWATRTWERLKKRQKRAGFP
jgi:transposase